MGDPVWVLAGVQRLSGQGTPVLQSSCISLSELLMHFLKPSTSIMRYDFKSESCFSGVLGYPGLTEVEVLGS